jgi:hypothetical protein
MYRNATLCSDGEIARVGFMNPNDGSDYVDRLVGFGLLFKRGERSRDIGVALQGDGLALPCDCWTMGPSKSRPDKPSARCG